MPLEEREQELYRRNTGKIPRPAAPRIRKTEPAPKTGGEWGKVAELPPPMLQPEMRRRIGRIFFWSIGTIAVLAAIGFGFFKWWSAPAVTLSIVGDREVRAGERQSYEIVIENSARSSLENVSLTIGAGTGVILPETSGRVILQQLEETLAPGTMRRVRFSAYFLGREDDERTIEVKLRYRLPNISSDFETTETLKAEITEPALAIAFDTPKQTLANTDFSFGLAWQNISELNILCVGSEFTYPDDFTFGRASPMSREGNEWQFGTLPSQATGTVAVTGRLAGRAGDVRTVKASVFTRVPCAGEKIVLGESSADISVIENPLIISMSVNGRTDYTAKPGETLEYMITFTNTYGEPLRDIVVTAKLSGAMFDMRSVSSQGSFDSRTNTITFHGGNTSQLLSLGPQQSGSVTFRVALLDTIPPALRDGSVGVAAAITSGTQPRLLGIEGPVTAESSLETKISGVLSLVTRALFGDPLYGSATVGPWPLKANETTRFAVHWVVRTEGSASKNVRVSTVLPGGVVYLGNVRGGVSGTQIVANPRTSAVEWQIPELGAFASKELVFQIEVTPSSPDIGSPITLLDAVNLTGTDAATGERTERQTDPVRSDTLNDPTIADPSTEGIVQP